MTNEDAVYTAWVDRVHQLGGVATAWPFDGPAIVSYDAKTGLPIRTGDPVSPDYGKPAARFPADVFAQLAGNELPMAVGVRFNNPGTWVYVLASAMNDGNIAVDQSSQAMTGATKAEAEYACAANGNCPTNLEELLKKIAIGAAVVAGVIVTVKALDLAKELS